MFLPRVTYILQRVRCPHTFKSRLSAASVGLSAPSLYPLPVFPAPRSTRPYIDPECADLTADTPRTEGGWEDARGRIPADAALKNILRLRYEKGGSLGMCRREFSTDFWWLTTTIYWFPKKKTAAELGSPEYIFLNWLITITYYCFLIRYLLIMFNVLRNYRFSFSPYIFSGCSFLLLSILLRLSQHNIENIIHRENYKNLLSP